MSHSGDAPLPYDSPCTECFGTGRVGLLGPSGLGLLTKPCPSCDFLARTVNERDALWELRERHCNIAFVPESDEAAQLLRRIWTAAFPDEAVAPAELSGKRQSLTACGQLRSESWKRLGFQSADPRTDVRTGRFVLDQFHYLAVMYPQSLQRLAKEAEDLEYFLAISCFNLTHMILVFFGLINVATVSPVPGAKPATRKQLLNFLGLCCRSPHSPATVLNELFVSLVERLNSTWRLMRATQQCNVMQHFQEALHGVFVANAACWDFPREAVDDFQIALAMPHCAVPSVAPMTESCRSLRMTNVS